MRIHRYISWGAWGVSLLPWVLLLGFAATGLFALFVTSLLALLPSGLLSASAGLLAFWMSKEAKTGSRLLYENAEIFVGVANCVLGVPALLLVYAVVH